MSNTAKTSRRLRKPKMYRATDDIGIIVSVPIREFGFSHLLFTSLHGPNTKFEPCICAPTPHPYSGGLATKAWLRYQDLLEPILRNKQPPVFVGTRVFWPSSRKRYERPWIKHLSRERVRELERRLFNE